MVDILTGTEAEEEEAVTTVLNYTIFHIAPSSPYSQFVSHSLAALPRAFNVVLVVVKVLGAVVVGPLVIALLLI